MIWNAVLWVIWRWRNKLIFENGVMDRTALINDVKLMSWKWWLGRSNATSCMLYEWIAEPLICMSWLVDQPPGSCGCGGSFSLAWIFLSLVFLAACNGFCLACIWIVLVVGVLLWPNFVFFIWVSLVLLVPKVTLLFLYIYILQFPKKKKKMFFYKLLNKHVFN
jgi:hypothetical protein